MEITRKLASTLLESVKRHPVVGLIGSRQVGKTTLAKAIAKDLPGKSLYLDLERPSDLAKLAEAELYLESHTEKLVILDEIQRRPDLFPILRALVDADRRPGRFLILGSASPDLLRQSSESLAGRILYHELSPLVLAEVAASRKHLQKIWLRGGFPDSYLARTDADSSTWREAFIQTHLERDLPVLGIQIPSAALRRFWEMVAHSHGQLWTSVKIASSLGISAPTVRRYLDILESTFMLRQLQPYHANLKKRLIKSPKVYLRDCGLLHTLLRLETLDDLLGHPIVGASWEGFVLEQIAASLPASSALYFYRTSGGAEIDVVVERGGRKPPLALEIKYSSDPTQSRGFWSALEDLKGAEAYVVCPTEEKYPIGKGVFALPVGEIPQICA